MKGKQLLMALLIVIVICGIISYISFTFYASLTPPPPPPPAPTPTPTPTPTPSPTPAPINQQTNSYKILDFEEVVNFNSTEETKNYRFKMSVGKDYRIQEYWVYQYLGDGKMRIKDFSDSETLIKEYKFIVQVGYPFKIGFAPPAKGRHYLVMPIEVGSKDLILRVEKIMGVSVK